MATRSTIAIEHLDGTVEQIYCHWDGYLSNNGKILFHHYKHRDSVAQLISGGDMSSLRPAIYECQFYRDREPKNDGHHPRNFENFEDYATNLEKEEYDYIFTKDNKWLVHCYIEMDDDDWVAEYRDLDKLLVLEALNEE